MEILRPIRREKIKFSLENCNIPSKLPKQVQNLIIDISNVAMYIKAYKEVGGDQDAVPFGRIQREVVLKAKDILTEISTKIHQKNNKGIIDSHNNRNPKESQLLIEEITTLSTNYYHLMPKV